MGQFSVEICTQVGQFSMKLTGCCNGRTSWQSSGRDDGGCQRDAKTHLPHRGQEPKSIVRYSRQLAARPTRIGS